MAMVERAHGRRTVPQIFIGETHVGGYDDMAALDRHGQLDPLLAQLSWEPDAASRALQMRLAGTDARSANLASRLRRS